MAWQAQGPFPGVVPANMAVDKYLPILSITIMIRENINIAKGALVKCYKI